MSKAQLLQSSIKEIGSQLEIQTIRKPFGGRWGVAVLIFCLFRVLFDNAGLTTMFTKRCQRQGSS